MRCLTPINTKDKQCPFFENCEATYKSLTKCFCKKKYDFYNLKDIMDKIR